MSMIGSSILTLESNHIGFVNSIAPRYKGQNKLYLGVIAFVEYEGYATARTLAPHLIKTFAMSALSCQAA